MALARAAGPRDLLDRVPLHPVAAACPNSIPTAMTEPRTTPRDRPPTMRGAVAGSLLVATIVVCAAAGFGLGALVGATVPLGLLGLFCGVALGIVLVIRRFGDLCADDAADPLPRPGAACARAAGVRGRGPADARLCGGRHGVARPARHPDRAVPQGAGLRRPSYRRGHRGRLHDRTRMARSAYDLRRRPEGRGCGPRRGRPRHRAVHRVLHRVHDHASVRPRHLEAALMRRRVLAALLPVAALLATPAGALAAINEAYRPQDEFKLDPWFSIGPIEFNKAVFYVLIATALTCFSMIYVARRMQARPNRLQTAVESAFLLMRDNITRGNMDDRMAAKWFPFIGTIFLFIWFSNILGYLPLPTNTEHTVNILGLEVPSLALFAATANLSVPLALTLVVWVSYHVEGIRAKGLVKCLAGWIPAGVEGPARAPIFVIEVISHLVRLVSLSVRLFANILAGHLLILFMGGGLVVLLNVAVGLAVILGLVTGALAVAFFLFEVGLVATLQAFIFATLTAIYLGGAVAEEH